MSSVLRVIPSSIYDRLVQEGILERELLKDRLLRNTPAKPGIEIVNHSEEEVQPTEPELDIYETHTEGSRKFSEYKWICFEEKYQLK